MSGIERVRADIRSEHDRAVAPPATEERLISIPRHKGGAVAVFATARHLARLIYRMLRYGHDYVDIGETAYDHQFGIRRLAALTETARTLGYTLVPKVAAE